MTEIKPIDRLLAVMARLRDPVIGCAWDRRQTFSTIAPYTIEEAYEVADAVARNDMADLRDELGDLLLQVVFQARIAEEAGAFDFDAVTDAITAKMQRRHPEIFDGDHEQSGEPASWEAHKARERAARATGVSSELDDVPHTLPALTRAAKLTQRAARVGFDWTDASEVLGKIYEEVHELEVEIGVGDLQAAREELGDVMFVCANLARKLDADPEDLLRGANRKFIRRFRHIEASLRAAGRTLEAASLAEMDDLWREAKMLERSATGGPNERGR